MSKSLEEILLAAAEETFGSMAFMFPLEDDASAAGGSDRCVVSVAFHGRFSGRLELAVAPEMASAIACNMLGLEEGQANPSQQLDALKEMGNVICGNILPQVSTAADVFEVCEPQIACGKGSGTNSAPGMVAKALLCLDSGPVELRLFLEGSGQKATASVETAR
jgi:CheY-specific phosphatase CheX